MVQAWGKECRGDNMVDLRTKEEWNEGKERTEAGPRCTSLYLK
jgi:hypothetical protein